MEQKRTSARRLFVISDLHLGGTPPPMMTSTKELATFISNLPERRRGDERLELVIAGDFVDFLAIAPFAAFTTSPLEARDKLRQMMQDAAFGTVFDALGRFVAAGHWLTVLLGNHDVELVFPSVQDAFLRHIDATPHDVQFVQDNRAYRVGALLIEHGNRYDSANENDWTGLRALVSALSRGEAPIDQLEVSAGSRLVESLISPLKSRYPFIDLLQPQGELVALFLVAFEPALILDLPKLGKLLKAKRLQDKNPQGLQPGETRHVAFASPTRKDPELDRVFGAAYATLRSENEQVGAWDVIRVAWEARNDSLSEILDRGGEVPVDRLEQIRVALRRLLLSDKSNARDGDTAQYGAAAKRMIASSQGEIETVVMGHTHLARHIGPAERASYINTGTWADVIRVPVDLLEERQHRQLQSFLAALRRGEGRICPRTYADVRVEPDGRVSAARLLPE
jgi:UDP-2,3-diacylglucosamine pyrophosphatase LpxH